MKIGFVDYELDEFHANTYLRIIRAESLAKGFEVAGCTAMTSGGKQWAEENDVPFYDTVEAMNEGVDCFAVLAPSNPEMHLDMCEKVFPCGKPTFVDKTFAPDFETAKRIFELADEWNVPVSSSSALRYTGIQDHVQTVGGRSNVQHMVVFAPGGSVHEYVIHPLEIVVSCMGASVTGVSKRGQGEYVQLLIDYAGGKTATLNLYCGTNTPYAATVTTGEETTFVTVDTGALFKNATGAMLELFKTGKPNVDRQETLAIMKLRDKALNE